MMERTAMVIGFNARPIVRLAKEVGLKVIAIDYWGDIDLKRYADIIFTVLHQKPGKSMRIPLHKPIADSLFQLAEEASQQYDVDFILLGSGLDDRPDLWVKLNKIAPLLSISPEKLRVVRDLIKLGSIAKKLGIKYPKTEKVENEEEAVNVSKDMGFPVVLKPIRSSGGSRLRIATSPDEVREKFKAVAGNIHQAYVRKYVKGINASSSIIGDGSKCKVISVNEQLIGLKELGATHPFTYCGNIVPLKAEREVIDRIKDVSCKLGEHLGLIGSVGFDFVIKDGEPYLMEVNPRFQATLECIYEVTGLNLVLEHIKSFERRLLTRVPDPKGYVVKMIVFAKGKAKVPNLSHMENLSDIPFPGVIVEKGDPVCTIHAQGNSRDEALSKAWEYVKQVYDKLR